MRILIADDSLISRRLLEEALRNTPFEVVSVDDGAAAWRVLNEPNAPTLAILDWIMPGYTGPELCHMIREKAAEPYTYIILLTSKNEKEDVVEGMEAGADDYLTKPFDRHELKVRLRAGTRILELQEQLVSARETLREQATRDYLTRLWNRSAILESLSRELSRSHREGSVFGVVLADLDHFKSINDTWGHEIGDVALKEAARCMRESLRPYDSIGRYGGEEFMMVLPGANLSDAAWLADRVRLAIRSAKVKAGDVEVQLSCSFGCASGSAGVPAADELIRVADEALYAAKHAGRNRVIALESPQGKFQPPTLAPASKLQLGEERLTFVQPESD